MVAEEKQTPMMMQYSSIKQNYKDEVVFFRLGDFYEMFNDDAIEVSRLLNLTLTHRQATPMCGVPYHAAKIYIARLLRLGKKIVICEQVGDIPKDGKSIATSLKSTISSFSRTRFIVSLFTPAHLTSRPATSKESRIMLF